jgi:hypothetical protein
MSGPLNLQVSKRSRIHGALVCDPFGWGCAMLLQGFADELQGGLLVPLGLNQHFKHLTFTISGAPEIHLLATDPDEHFVSNTVRSCRIVKPLQSGQRAWNVTSPFLMRLGC